MKSIKPVNSGLKVFPKVISVSITLLFISCNPPKTLYLSNKTGKAITLVIDENLTVDKQSEQTKFIDSLNGKFIEPGHIVINFGEGKWNKNDRKNLKAILSKANVIVEGSEERHPLPGDIKVEHISLFVEELLVRFRKIE